MPDLTPTLSAFTSSSQVSSHVLAQLLHYPESNTKHKGMVTITHVLVQLECKHAIKILQLVAIKILQLVTSKYCNLIGDCKDTSTTLDCHQTPVLHSIHCIVYAITV